MATPTGAVLTRPDVAPLLAIEDLSVAFDTPRGAARVVDDVSYDVRAGEIVAVVGESGCGKSVTALAVMGLLPRPAASVLSGRVMFEGKNLLGMPRDEMRGLRGREIAMIFQEPMTALNPVMSIGDQLAEPLRIHRGLTGEAARRRVIEVLGLVGISDPERRLEQYPHQFSGGMRQRVMIAMGLVCEPKLIIADEPTTALDVTVQLQVLELLRKLATDLGIAVVLITHNLGIVARYADRVNVMYAGRVVERREAGALFAEPRHPYTAGLLDAVPRLDRPLGDRLRTIEGAPPNLASPPSGCRFAPRCALRTDICTIDPPAVMLPDGGTSACHHHRKVKAAVVDARAPATIVDVPPGRQPILSVRGLSKHFEVGGLFGGTVGAMVRAVDDVSFDLEPGRTLGLVGESGCGKTTVGRLLLRLETASAGEIRFEGLDFGALAEKDLRRHRRRLGVVFQDPSSSLNPRMTIGQTLREPLRVHDLVHGRARIARRVGELLTSVGLPETMAERYPHQLSGGQRQRVGIARALAMEPSVIVCDEAVSALDVSVQGQVVNLLADLQARLGLSFLFIAHDLAVVRAVAHRVMVMYLGRVMEVADSRALYGTPLHPYTRALLAAAPLPDPVTERRRPAAILRGEVPSPLRPPGGCVFHSRCPMAVEECARVVPVLEEKRAGHRAACIRV